MEVQDAVEFVGKKFVYEKDPKIIGGLGDTWQVLPLVNDNFKGDCDDFAMTCLWYISNQNLFKFIWNVFITHNYKLYRCKTVTNEWHIVTCVNGLWFDNWTRKTLSKEEFFKETGHDLKMRYIAPMIIYFMILGFIIK